MFALALPRAGRIGLPMLVAYSPQTLSFPLRRWIFNPSLKPPHTGPAVHKEFPQESRAHVSAQQFREIIRAGPLTLNLGEMYGMHNAGPKTWEEIAKMTPAERWENKAFKLKTQPVNTYAGRSAPVMNGDIAQAWSRLSTILRQNNVRQELRLAERHEKKGDKRRRLRSEKWRRKFADEVRKKVKLVNEIRLRDRMWGASRH